MGRCCVSPGPSYREYAGGTAVEVMWALLGMQRPGERPPPLAQMYHSTMWRSARTSHELPAERRNGPGRVRVGPALAVALALIAAALGVTLSGSPLVVARANSTSPAGPLAETYSAAGACQAGEVLPAGTSAIRLTLSSDAGPRVRVSVLSGSHVITSGTAASGWTSGAVTVPVRPVARAASNVRICFGLGPTREQVAIVGSPTSRVVAAIASQGRALPGRIRIEYLRAGDSSWWSLASSVARRMGLGRAPAGAWIALLPLALMGIVVLTTSRLILRELR